MNLKLTFFLIGFCLVFLEAYFYWTGRRPNDGKHGSIIISSNGWKEEIKWSGRIRLSDDESSIADITPGGYFKFRWNAQKMLAESDLQGRISYELDDGSGELPMNDSGRRFVKYVLREALACGLNANGRAERIFRKGGGRAVLDELPRLRINTVKLPYLKLLMTQDSLPAEEQLETLRQIKNLGIGFEEADLLKQFSAQQLGDSLLRRAWLDIVNKIGPDVMKLDLLKFLIRQIPVDEATYNQVLHVAVGIGPDFERADLLKELMQTDSLPAASFGVLLQMVNSMGPDALKVEMYKVLMAGHIKTASEWEELIRSSARISADFEKSALLTDIARVMPADSAVRAAYLETAKTISNDMDYGKALRAVE